jgi:hypothetical protein
LEYLSSVSSPVQRLQRSTGPQHGFRAQDNEEFEPSGSSAETKGAASESNSMSDVGPEKSHAGHLHSDSPSNDASIPRGRPGASQIDITLLQQMLQESDLSKAILHQKVEAQELKLKQLTAQLEEQSQMRARQSRQFDTSHHESQKGIESLESANAAHISRARVLEEEVAALKQSNKHLTSELEKSIKVAKDFELRSQENEVRYQDANQALTNWKRTAQELGQQVS